MIPAAFINRTKHVGELSRVVNKLCKLFNESRAINYRVAICLRPFHAECGVFSALTWVAQKLNNMARHRFIIVNFVQQVTAGEQHPI